jgi:hypothetical protein
MQVPQRGQCPNTITIHVFILSSFKTSFIRLSLPLQRLDNHIAGLLESLASGILGSALISMFQEFSKRGSMLDSNAGFAVDRRQWTRLSFGNPECAGY